MSATLPPDLVLAIVRLAVQQARQSDSFLDYQDLLAKLCRVCKAFNQVLHPALWSKLCVLGVRQLKKIPKDVAPCRLQHVETFIGIEPARPRTISLEAWMFEVPDSDYRSREKPAQLVRAKAPQVQDLRLSRFGRKWIALEAFKNFSGECCPQTASNAKLTSPNTAALTSLLLDDYHFAPLATSVKFPALESLALIRTTAARQTYRNLLSPACTPRLFALHLRLLHDEGDECDMPYGILPLDGVDLSRIRLVQLHTQDVDALPQPMLAPDGPFHPETYALLSWEAPDDGLFAVDNIPPFFQLEIPKPVLEDFSRAHMRFDSLALRIAELVRLDYVRVVFLPDFVRDPNNLEFWITPGIKTILDACRKTKAIVQFYGAAKDPMGFFTDPYSRKAVFSVALWDHVGTDRPADENPLVDEANITRARSSFTKRWSDVSALNPKEDPYEDIWDYRSGGSDQESSSYDDHAEQEEESE